MKTLPLLALILALAVAALPAVAADNTPAITIDQALKIAQDYLAKSGAAADHQIIGISLEAASLGTTYWYAHWTPSIGDGQKKQIGMRIDMDGSTTLFVTGSSPAGSGGTGGGFDRPVGQRAQGARNLH